MRAGCPFIAFNSSAIPEVAGNAGILLNNLSFNSFHNAIDNLIENRNDIIMQGYIQVSKFSWKKCYDETYNIYKIYTKQC